MSPHALALVGLLAGGCARPAAPHAPSAETPSSSDAGSDARADAAPPTAEDDDFPQPSDDPTPSLQASR